MLALEIRVLDSDERPRLEMCARRRRAGCRDGYLDEAPRDITIGEVARRATALHRRKERGRSGRHLLGVELGVVQRSHGWVIHARMAWS